MMITGIKNGKIVEPNNTRLPLKYKYDGRGLDRLILYTEITSLNDCEEMIDFFTILRASFYKPTNKKPNQK